MAESVYLPSRYNQAINLTIYDKDRLEVPIIYYSDTKDIVVSLSLHNFQVQRDQANNQFLTDKIGKREFFLTPQSFQSNGLNVFGRILTKQDFPNLGFYTGNIIVRRSYYPDTNPDANNTALDLVPVTINVEPSPLDRYTEFASSNGVERMTVKDMLEEVFVSVYLSPRFVMKKKDGKFVVEYGIKQPQDYIQIFRGEDIDYMPRGSMATVVSEDSNTPVNGYYRVPLLRTDAYGKDIHSGMQITKDQRPASFIPISGLKAGNYLVYAEYMSEGGMKHTEYVPFRINDC